MKSPAIAAKLDMGISRRKTAQLLKLPLCSTAFTMVIMKLLTISPIPTLTSRKAR